ncbi:MAG TPA: vitamin B12-dependent ribonucleotide reductase [Epulopiscium sp.]|nr:vitamin B12-dependent ribonucleotide reductase [Candidatus Epulonipiscium sp.]
MKLDDLIVRYYTEELENSSKTVYDLFTWHNVNVKILNYSTGEAIVDMPNLEFPSHFSQSACDIIASKYLRKGGIPGELGYENSFKQLIHRMVAFWVDAACDEKLINQDQKEIVYDELAYMMISQMWAPNSPQWFNTGLKTAYGIEGPSQGHYYYDPEQGKSVLSPDSYTRTQGSACFIVGVQDSLLGERSLTDQLVTETRLFKYGSGVGTNWSPIRGKGESLSGGGKSSGLMSFLRVFDRNAGAIKSGGTTRRAAKMNVLDIDHPEIEEFIAWKSIEEDKVSALGKMGYDTHFDGEAYDTVSGQNANNSVRVSDGFMKSIHDPEASIPLMNRLDGKVSKEANVKSLWDGINQASWRCGDPGIQFDDVINAWHTCPSGEDGAYNAKHNRINASNPCSEYMFLDDTACNLASINIVKFYDPEENLLDIEGYLHCIKMTQIVLEATIHWGQFPTEPIARKSYHFRTTGLGLTNLGTLFMLMTLPYDSDEARNIGSSLMSTLTGYSYYISSLFAQKVGPFTYYDLNKDHMLKVMNSHGAVAGYPNEDIILKDTLNYEPIKINHGLLGSLNLNELSSCVKDVWKHAINSGAKHGYRNAQVSVLAPTGTIAFAMDCATTSSEPFFSHVAYKKLVGGGSMEIINPVMPVALAKLGYEQNQIDEIIAYILRKEDMGGYEVIMDGKIEGAPHLSPEHYPIFDTANRCGTGQRFIAPDGHVEMMAALTPNVSGAISKTVNLPQDATTEDIGNIYELSWKLGVKSIALYRDGCKESQPLNTAISDTAKENLEDLSYAQLLKLAQTQESQTHLPRRIKPTGIRRAHVHEAQMAGLKLYFTLSFYEDGRLGEVYVSAGRQGSLAKGLLDSVSTTISKMLQYGVPAKDISQMYRGQKYEPSGFVYGHPYIKMADSISDLISKIIDIELGDYTSCQVTPTVPLVPTMVLPIQNPTTPSNVQGERLYGEVCSSCKGTKLVKNGTCKVCLDCGTTTGCS